ncbi:MAG: bifunctional oligoribonuclease/PAP phosphatase NrnA [Flavobacteriales bacterium]|jgi:bifunctional oligoribonuclease and PAP phosphatase NrnA|nr:bifunctional oligoribonuclease/PAP phosphatase NrnA [Flavobacteriales bacterium]
MNNETFDTLKQLLSQPKKIVIVPHQNPDGDAMGSTLALNIFLNKLGHAAAVVSPNDYPKFLKWLPQSDGVVFFDKDNSKANILINEAEMVFILDFNALHRTGDAMATVLENCKATFVMIDHHQQPDVFTDFMYSDVSICATSQMVYHFIERLDYLDKMDAAIATCLYTGIMTDTGSFKYKSTTSTTHRVVAELIDCGADNSDVHSQVYDNNSYHQLQLLGSVLKNLKVLPEYNTAYMYLTEADKDTYNFKKGDSEGFVNYCLSIENINLAAIFIEDKVQGIIKMSLRSKGDFSVNDFARNHFNGGGHINAAGGRSDVDLKATIKKFLSVLPQYKNDLNK